MTENTFTANGYEIPGEFILRLKDQVFIRVGGLLWLANQMGMLKIVTKNVSTPGVPEVIYEAEGRLIPNATTLENMGYGKDYPLELVQMFTLPTIAHGTCNQDNTKDGMQKFAQVLAETRAIARCLRFLTGCALTAVEEMDSSDLAGNMDSPKMVSATAADLLKNEPGSREEMVKVIADLMDKQPFKAIVDLYCKQKKAPLFTALKDEEIRELFEMCKAKAN